MRFMAIASVSCASLLIEPNDMAPVAKRFTISEAGSTSSSGTGGPFGLKSNMPRSISRSRFCWSTIFANSSKLSKLDCRTACCSLLTVSGFKKVALAAHAILIFAADPKFRFRLAGRLHGELVLHQRFARQHFDAHAFDARGVPVK